MKSYKIHDNGGRPFKVNVFTADPDKPKIVHIYGPKYPRERAKIAEVSAEDVFIGYTPAITGYGCGDEFLGNTILLKLGGLEYVWIGNRGILKFFASREIADFASPVGNSNVPYPYAIDTLGNYYLMLENVILNARPEFYQPGFDPYNYYYNNQRVCSLRGASSICLNFDGITGQKINGQKLWITVCPNPAADYDRLTNTFGHDIQFQYGNEWRPISRDTYIEIMTRAAAKLGINEFQTECVCKRGGRSKLTVRIQN